MHMDYYSELGVTSQAEPEVIRAVYRVLAQRFHPDRQTGACQATQDKMARINRAYAVLSREETRRAYDQMCSDQPAAQVTRPQPASSRTRPSRVAPPYLTTYDRFGRLHAYA